MIDGKRLIVVMPAYNAARTLLRSYEDLPHDIVDEVIVVDDASHDETVALAQQLGLTVIRHEENLGYGGNQKTCYRAALDRGADIVVMVHPDYQYSPKLCGAMAWMVASGEYDVVLASRILGKGALEGGMPVYKYVANRLLTLGQNLLLGMTLSEYHTGYRAYTREVLEALPLGENSDDFVFDNEIIAQTVRAGFRIGEISCPTRYDADSSSIDFRRSCRYGLGVIATSVAFRLDAMGFRRARIFAADGRRLDDEEGPEAVSAHDGSSDPAMLPPRQGEPADARVDPRLRTAFGRSAAALEALPGWVLPVVAFLVSAVAQVSRWPDLFARPQFFAEDGHLYAQAHNLGAFEALWVQSNGYLQLLPRLVAAAAQALPLAWGPASMLAGGAAVNALVAAFLVSPRMRTAIPSVWARVLLVLLYVALPGAAHTASILTYSQWHLSLVALMVLIADPPKGRVGRVADVLLLILCGLSGPYSLLLAVVALVHWYVRPAPRAFWHVALLGATAIVQVATILTVGLAARSTVPHGATAFLFFRILGGRVFYGATVGHHLQSSSLPATAFGNEVFIAWAGGIGVVMCAMVFVRASHALRMMMLYGALIVAAVLVSASVPPDGPPQWEVLRHQTALTTYFVVPILCVYAASVWMLGQRSFGWRAVGAVVLMLAAVVAIPQDWREPPVEDLDFPASVRRYEASAPGTAVVVPTPPSPWSIELVKPAEERSRVLSRSGGS